MRIDEDELQLLFKADRYGDCVVLLLPLIQHLAQVHQSSTMKNADDLAGAATLELLQSMPRWRDRYEEVRIFSLAYRVIQCAIFRHFKKAYIPGSQLEDWSPDFWYEPHQSIEARTEIISMLHCRRTGWPQAERELADRLAVLLAEGDVEDFQTLRDFAKQHGLNEDILLRVMRRIRSVYRPSANKRGKRVLSLAEAKDILDAYYVRGIRAKTLAVQYRVTMTRISGIVRGIEFPELRAQYGQSHRHTPSGNRVVLSRSDIFWILDHPEIHKNELAARFGCSRTAIYCVRTGKHHQDIIAEWKCAHEEAFATLPDELHEPCPGPSEPVQSDSRPEDRETFVRSLPLRWVGSSRS